MFCISAQNNFIKHIIVKSNSPNSWKDILVSINIKYFVKNYIKKKHNRTIRKT